MMAEKKEEAVLKSDHEKEKESQAVQTTNSVRKESVLSSDPPLSDKVEENHKNNESENVSCLKGTVHHPVHHRTSVNDIYASCSKLISRTASTCTQDENGSPFPGAVSVQPRYRHIPSRSQGSISAFNGEADTHSRVSSRERFSWDLMAWKEMGANLDYANHAPRDYLQIGRTPSESIYSAQDTDARPRRHARSLAAWDRTEVEALGEGAKDDATAVPTQNGHVTPIGRGGLGVEPLFETAPIGHQHSFSLPSHKDAIHRVQYADEKQSEREEDGTSAKAPVMTHIMVRFKELYGMFYVPESEWGTFNVGDLVTVESHTGENTGRVVCDLTEIMKNPTLIPANFSLLSREVLYPEDPSKPLEIVDPVTGAETLLRLPRVIRRGMNKGKKRLYYARRRDAEALGTCQRIIRERSFRINVTGVEYQVDFKRITIFCAGASTTANRQEANVFIQHLAPNLRGSTVGVLFSNDLPESLEITRGITNGAFNALYIDYKMRMQENEGSSSTLQSPSHHAARMPRAFTECSVNNPGPAMPMHGLPSGPMRHPVKMPMSGANLMLGVPRTPPMPWGAALSMITPPPYGQPYVHPGLSGTL